MPANSSANDAVRVRPPASARRATALVGATAVVAVVVVEEDLLQRGLAAGERDDLVVGERVDQRTDAARYLAAERVRARVDDVDAGERELRWLSGEGDLDPLRA